MKSLRIAALTAAMLGTVAASAAAAEAVPARIGSQIGESENLDGPTLTALAVLVAVIAGVVIFADGDGDDTPVSP